MNCRKVQSLISAYVDCELAGLEMLSIRHHLSTCQRCNAEFQSMLLIKRTLGALPQKHPSPSLAVQICRQMNYTPEPAYTRALHALRMHFSPHPTKLSLTAISVGFVAALLVLNPGDMDKSRQVYHALRPVQIDAIAIDDPIEGFTSTARTTSVSTDTRYATVNRPWGLSRQYDQQDDPTGQTRVLLTSY